MFDGMSLAVHHNGKISGYILQRERGYECLVVVGEPASLDEAKRLIENAITVQDVASKRGLEWIDDNHI